MAWEIITKDEVALICGAAPSAIQDEWYDMAVALIARQANINNIALPVSVTEVHSGDGTQYIAVRQPPISSVTSVAIEGVTQPSGMYTFDKSRIILVDADSSNPYVTKPRFIAGDQNVTVTYVSGTATPDKSVALAIALIVKELANLRTMEGAASLVQFYRPGQSDATERPLYEWGVHGKIHGIIVTLLGSRVRAR